MKWRKKSLLELAAVLVIVAVVSVLAVLQYRWAGQISRVEQNRLKSQLANSVSDFDQEFSYDFERISETFQNDTDSPPTFLDARVAQQYANWIKAAAHPGLIAGVHIWRTAYAPEASFESLDTVSGRFQKVPWPSRLDHLYQFLVPQISYVAPMRNDRETLLYPWTFYEDQPAFVRPILEVAPNVKDPAFAVEPVGVLIIELDKNYLQRQYFPELVERAFGASGNRTFDAAVRTAKPPYAAIYSSEPSFSVSTESPDATLNLFDSVQDVGKRRGYPPVQPSSESRQWQLAVQHPEGSLAGLVGTWRERNLAIGFGLLAILAGCMVFIFVLARREEQLARLQIEFVAGVSHELCTPLAIINSAAENIADGVVDSPQQLAEYGGLIAGQGRRLERLVDQILLFAAGRFDPSKIECELIQLAPLVARCLVESEPMLREAGFTIEKDINTPVPRAIADSSVVTKCLENLIGNAMKYGGTNRWLAVRLRMTSEPKPEVRISVEDRGLGIPAADLPHIFEAFYRVQAVREGQTRGVGLGLYLVKQMMESMGGRVTVSSQPQRGTVFVLHFPLLELSPEQGQLAMPAEVPVRLAPGK
jgi:signal transduction histidine kinase/type II secretory pathway pseudopilin PulG